jgi:hypothetical protein
MLAPFAEEELHTFKGRGGSDMTYIEDETVMDRLDLGYGPGNWQVRCDPVSNSVVKVILSVREGKEWVSFEDFGYPNREGGESLKEAVSDGIRRCGRFVGIARDLYRKAPDEKRGDRPAPPRLPAREDPATVEPEPSKEPNTETEEIVGRVRRRGMVRKGTSKDYQLDARQGPDGHVIGFRLEVGPEKHIPQCLVVGPLGESLFLATGGDPTKLVGKAATVAGILYYVKSNRASKDGSPSRGWYRLHVDRFENADWILPPDPDVVLPVPPDDVPLVGEAETVPLDLA